MALVELWRQSEANSLAQLSALQKSLNMCFLLDAAGAAESERILLLLSYSHLLDGRNMWCFIRSQDEQGVRQEKNLFSMSRFSDIKVPSYRGWLLVATNIAHMAIRLFDATSASGGRLTTNCSQLSLVEVESTDCTADFLDASRCFIPDTSHPPCRRLAITCGWFCCSPWL
eukprot:scaffold468159_cov39-Prasinocladus_malaysianus.AAC.1